MAEKVASLYGELNLTDNMTPSLKKAEGNLSSFGGALKSAGTKVANFGAGLLKMSAPVVAGFGIAVSAAMGFDEAMTNTAAVMGLTREQTAALGDQLLQIGADSQAGPQAVADAYYDIAGGVADASTHMAIMEAAIATAEAGNADLGDTTRALIAVMNSYEFAATDAAYASDVMTRTVGMGVGTMNDLAGAMPQVTGLANSLGISFEDLGGMMAYLSTKGNTFSESATQISAMMTAMIKPNQDMTAALKDLGYETGQAAIDALGLQGAYQALVDAGHGDQMAALTGSVEALRGVTALTAPDVKNVADNLGMMNVALTDVSNSGAVGFMEKFGEGLTGITQSTREIQLTSLSAQMRDLTTDMDAFGIKMGLTVAPALSQVWEGLKPVIASVGEWVAKNPEAVATIGKFAAAAALVGGALVPIGGLIMGIAGTLGVLTSPVGIATTLFAGLGIAINSVIQSWNNWQNTVANTPKEILSPQGFSRLQAGLGTSISRNQAIGRAVGIPGAVLDAMYPTTSKAGGGGFMAGQAITVGENGREVVQFGSAGRVFNQRQMSGAGGMSINGGTFIFNGVNNIQQLYDELTQVGLQRGE